MEDRETARMRKYGESKTTRIMMATVPHVSSGSGLRKISGRWIFCSKECTWLLTRIKYLAQFVGKSKRFTSSPHLCNCKHDNDPHAHYVSHAQSVSHPAKQPKAVNMFNTAATPVISLLLKHRLLRCISGNRITNYVDIESSTYMMKSEKLE